MTRATEQSGEHATGLPELDEALAALLDGNLPFATFRDLIANRVYADSDDAVVLLPWLERLRNEGSLPNHLVSLLESDVRRICNEDVPTEVDVFAAAEATGGDAQQADEDFAGDAPSAEILALREAHQLSIGDVLCERYEIVSRAHGGNMSAVYKGHDIPTGNAVAIKLLLPELSGSGRAVRALQDEFEKGRRCQHPNIVRYYALERHNNVFFIVMEWLAGEHLAERINREPGVAQSFEWTFGIVERLASALGVIHEQGFVHADVKPGNVMLLTNGDIKLFDFGVTQAYGQHAKERVAFDASVLAAATPAYSSAGVLDGEPLAPTDDVYSLACLTYRMLAGARPYGELTAKMARDSRVKPERLAALPAAAWMSLSNALGHEPDARPQSVQAFVEGIRATTARDGAKRRRMSGAAMGWWTATAIVLAGAVAVTVSMDWADSLGPAEAVTATKPAPRTGAGPILESEVLPVTGAESSDVTVPSPVDVDGTDQPVTAAATIDTDAVANEAVTGTASPAGTAAPSDEFEVVAADVALPADTADSSDTTPPLQGDEVPVAPADELDSLTESTNGSPVSTNVSAVSLPLLGELAPLVLVETDPLMTLAFDASAIELTNVGVYLNALTQDAYRQTLSLLDSGVQPVIDGVISIRLQPRASWIDAPPRAYRLIIVDPASGRVLAELPIDVMDQNRNISTRVPDPRPIPVSDAANIDDLVVTNQESAEPIRLVQPTVIGFDRPIRTVFEDQRVINVTINKRGVEAVVVQVAIDGDTAVDGEDFIAPVRNTIDIAASQSTATFRIALVDDAQWEGEEVFRVRIIAPRGEDAVFDQSQTIVIRDDDPAPATNGEEEL
ncbi:MAG: protein kinase [Pseudomonadota bacterium]